MFEKICPICDEKFKGEEKQIVYSRKCSGKYIRQQQALKNKRKCENCENDLGYRQKRFCSKSCLLETINRTRSDKISFCIECNEPFHPKNSRQKMCAKKKKRKCDTCGKIFFYICKSQKVRKNCSRQCGSKAEIMRNRNKEREVICSWCDKTFKTKHPFQKFCKNDYGTCYVCEKEFKCEGSELTKNKEKTCSKKCSSIRFLIGKIPKEKVLEYMDIDTWAIKFLKEVGRKPTRFDVKETFKNVKFPYFAKKDLFDLTVGTASLEDPVYKYLIDNGIEVERRVNCIPSPYSKNRKLQIDIYVPSIKMGIEVQDFWTHDKMKDNIPIPEMKRMKRGPRYHETKRRLAKNMGIILIDIWEDTIRNGEYKEWLNVNIIKKVRESKND